MSPIAPLWNEMPLQPIRPVAGAPVGAVREGASFTDIFHEAISAVRQTDADKTELQYLMATGQLDNPSLLSIASSKAELSVQLLVQLRDRSLQAYNELMRISL